MQADLCHDYVEAFKRVASVVPQVYYTSVALALRLLLSTGQARLLCYAGRHTPYKKGRGGLMLRTLTAPPRVEVITR